jgi:Fe-S cluster assembly protein SufD
MSALLDSLANGFSGDAGRRAQLDAIVAEGLPGPRSEAWKYAPLRALERRSFEPAPIALATYDPALVATIPAPRLVFVNGRFDPSASDGRGLPDGVELLPLSQVLREGSPRDGNVLQRRFDGRDEVFARLNAALAVEGAVLRIEDGVSVELPVHLVFIGAPSTGDVAWHARHLIALRANASASVVEHHLSAGAHAHLGNALTHVHLGHGAQLVHARVQDEATGAIALARTDAVLARDARYTRVDLELGGGLSRHELNVRLEGTGASVLANGVLLGSGRQHLETRLGIEHIARDTRCDLVWRGLAAGRARSVFHGGIVIRPGADGSDATLSNKNLLLGENAEIDAQPVLEIHADEVKAAHGATVGQLDPTALFYLRSRGLPEPAARRLLTGAFCREIVAVIEHPALRDALTAALDRALARMDVA